MIVVGQIRLWWLYLVQEVIKPVELGEGGLGLGDEVVGGRNGRFYTGCFDRLSNRYIYHFIFTNDGVATAEFFIGFAEGILERRRRGAGLDR